jgi:hypothetical protein
MPQMPTAKTSAPEKDSPLLPVADHGDLNMKLCYVPRNIGSDCESILR